MEGNPVIVQRDRYSVLDCWIVFSFIIFIGWVALKVSFPNAPVLGLSVVANLILMLSILSKYRLKRIVLDTSKNTIHLKRDKWFFIKNEIVLPLENTSMKMTKVNRGFGIKVTVFSIFSKTQKITEAITGFSGWKEEDLNYIQKIIDKSKG